MNNLGVSGQSYPVSMLCLSWSYTQTGTYSKLVGFVLFFINLVLICIHKMIVMWTLIRYREEGCSAVVLVKMGVSDEFTDATVTIIFGINCYINGFIDIMFTLTSCNGLFFT